MLSSSSFLFSYEPCCCLSLTSLLLFLWAGLNHSWLNQYTLRVEQSFLSSACMRMLLDYTASPALPADKANLALLCFCLLRVSCCLLCCAISRVDMDSAPKIKE